MFPAGACVLLTYPNGDLAGRWWHLDPLHDDGRAIMGRSRDNRIVLLNASIARRHAELRFRDGGWWVRDYRSTNGTRVDDRRVLDDPIRLRDGMEVQPAMIRMSFFEGVGVAQRLRAALFRLKLFDGLTNCMRPSAFRRHLEAGGDAYGRTLQLKLETDTISRTVGPADDIVREAAARLAAALPSSVIGNAGDTTLAATNVPPDVDVAALTTKIIEEPFTLWEQPIECPVVVTEQAPVIPDVAEPPALAALPVPACPSCDNTSLQYVRTADELACPRCDAMYALSPDVFWPDRTP